MSFNRRPNFLRPPRDRAQDIRLRACQHPPENLPRLGGFAEAARGTRGSFDEWPLMDRQHWLGEPRTATARPLVRGGGVLPVRKGPLVWRI